MRRREPLDLRLACEDRRHFEAVTTLTDRVLVEEISWLEDPDWVRRWQGLEPGTDWWKISGRDAKSRLDKNRKRRRLHGMIKGKPLKPAAAHFRRVLVLFSDEDPCPDALFMAQDYDRGDWVEGLEQVLSMPRRFKVVLAAPKPEIEAWYVAGFEPNTSFEHRLLAESSEELGFSPTEQPHRLTAQPNDARTDAKRVLERLVQEDEERARETLMVDLELLERRGERAGLADFLGQIRERLIPLVGSGEGGAR